MLGALSLQAQTYLIDFGGDNTTVRGPVPDDPANYWNNVTGTVGFSAAGVLSNLVSTLNSNSPICLRMVRPFNGVNENGTQASLLYPVDATRDSLYGNTESFNGLTNIFPSFKFTGLDAGTKYSFTFYASRTGVSDNRETGYTLVGAGTDFVALDPANNIDLTVSVTNLIPDAAGEITISIAPTANNNNANHFTYLGIMRVDAVPPQTPLAFVEQPASQRVIQLHPATFTAAVSGPPPYFVQWYENGVPIPDANQFSYTIPSAGLYMDGWLYSVTVSNLAYGVSSTNAVLRVNSDTNPPVLVQAASYDGMNIVVTFNEPMDTTTHDSANYLVNNGAVGVIGAILEADGQAVTLNLDGAISGTFLLKVSNVQDTAGNPIAPGSTITGAVIALEEQDLLFDFGGSNTTQHGPDPDDPSNYWNNVTTTVGSSDTGQLLNLVTAHNAQTPFNLIMLQRFNGANENGTLVSTVFPQKATRDSLYGNTEAFNNLASIFPKFQLNGLNPARKYTFTFYASRTSVSDNRETGYTVVGASTNSTALNAANNINNTTQIAGVAPNAAGEITISLAPTANNNNANHFTYLGAMRVAPCAPPLQFLATVIESGQIKLQWTGTGQLQRAPSVLGPWTSIEPAPSSPYLQPLVPGENRFYRLQQ